ncbi:MAG: hypothetical protein ACFCU1_14395 [Sumerlaeia bacterium]
MLINKKMANTFLVHYKAIMSFLNGGVEPEDVHTYVSIRPRIFANIEYIEEYIKKIVGEEFLRSVKLGVYGKFIYLKKYQKGYVLRNIESGKYYQVLSLTTPLEEHLGEYSIIETAIMPYANKIVSDGLVLRHEVGIGNRMISGIREDYRSAKKWVN